MNIKNFILLITACLAMLMSQGQSCDAPVNLCAEIAASGGSITSPAPVNFGCLNVSSSYFYSFQTSASDNPGTAILNIENINCSSTSGAGTLYAMVVTPPAIGLGDPCDPANWVQVSDCVFDTLSISLETPNLEPTTTYYLILGSNQSINQLDCQFDVSVSGTAVDINACCDNQVSLGEATQLTVVGGSTPPGYTWSPPSWLDDPNLETPTSYPEETTEYQVTGYIGDCAVTDIVTIFVGPPISVFNTFTPNGDGINDTWGIAGISSFDGALINVYDRWGQLVFKSLGYAKEWDGTNRGKFLPTATYYYVIELNSLDVNIPPVTGYVAIIH